MEQRALTEYRIKNEEETRAFALALAQKLAAGDVLALIGDLGGENYEVVRYYPMPGRNFKVAITYSL